MASENKGYAEAILQDGHYGLSGATLAFLCQDETSRGGEKNR